MGTENKIERELVSIETFSPEDGMVYWIKKFNDGTVSGMERTGISKNDSRALRLLYKNLESEFGVPVNPA